jgi:protein ImuA
MYADFHPQSATLAALRTQIRAIETHGREACPVLETGALGLDQALGGGLALGGVSELVPAAFMDEPTSIRFALACAATAMRQRLGDLVVIEDGSHARTWGQFYGPGLQALGVCPSRLVVVTTPDTKLFHACLEDAARTQGLAGIVACAGPKAGFSLAGARRVQLAAEQSHGLVLLVQSLRTMAFAPARARLRVASAPCTPQPVGTALPALGPPAWTIALERARSGARPQSFHLEYDYATHRLYQPAALANRPSDPHLLFA